MAAELTDWLLRSALALTLALAVLLPLRPLWRRALGAGGVLWLWLLVPAVLVATSVPRPAFDAAPTPSAATRVAAGPATPAAAKPYLEATTPATMLRRGFARIDTLAPAWLLAPWLLGAGLLAALFVQRQRAYVRTLGPLQPREDGCWRAATAAMHPAVIGVLRPRIVLPADFESRFDAVQQRLVLAHERVHLRRGDLHANLAMCALRCLFWFHPLVHVAASRLRLDQELACDARVLAEHPGAGRAYASALLNTQLAVPGLPVGCAWQSSHPLKWRIAMLKRRPPGLARLSLGVALALLASSATAMTLWQLQPLPDLPALSPLPALESLETLAPPGTLPRLEPLALLAAVDAPTDAIPAPVAQPSPRPVTTPAPVALPSPTPVAAAAPQAPRPTTPVADTPAPAAPVPTTPATPAAAPVAPVPAVPASERPEPRAPEPAVPAGTASPAAEAIPAEPLAWLPWRRPAPAAGVGC